MPHPTTLPELLSVSDVRRVLRPSKQQALLPLKQCPRRVLKLASCGDRRRENSGQLLYHVEQEAEWPHKMTLPMRSPHTTCFETSLKVMICASMKHFQGCINVGAGQLTSAPHSCHTVHADHYTTMLSICVCKRILQAHG